MGVDSVIGIVVVVFFGGLVCFDGMNFGMCGFGFFDYCCVCIRLSMVFVGVWWY